MKPNLFPLLMCLLCALAVSTVHGADKAKSKESKNDSASEEKDADASKPKTIEEATKDAERVTGLFDLYRDRKTGAVHLAIRKNQLGKEFIYFTHTRDGVPSVGHFRGGFRDTQVFTVERHYNRIELVAENTAFYFNKKNPLSRAANANITRAVLASEPIVAEDKKKGIVLIDAGKIFLTEALHKVSPRKNPDQKNKGGFSLGSLSKDKTRFAEIKNYPENTAFVVEYVYDNPEGKASNLPEVTDPRYVTIRLQHTLIQMPRNRYAPRFDDPRVGFFSGKVTDLTSASATPWRDVIHRWHLEKKNPDADLSDPVEPITWWIENTTPRELRKTIREAGLLWNEAFETAGFKNAVVIKEQPDDAKWDAGDIRYNVLRWTSSPSPPFGGYGPSFVNPRTGQILGADIMLEYVFMTNRVQSGQVFDEAALFRPAEVSGDAEHESRSCCQLGNCLQRNNLFGVHALKAKGAGKLKVDALLKESLHYLVLHEIGHTLGLSHNMKASQLHGPEVIHDRSVTEKTGVAASVMDYPAVNFAPPGVKQGQYYNLRPGPYDHWAIEFGYSPAAKSSKEETERLKAILDRSTEAALAFGNDADDMRSVGRGIDPRVMINDLSKDAVAYAEERCALIEKLLEGLLEKAVGDGESYHGLRNAYLILTGQFDDAVTAMSRYVGGVYVDRSFAGQEGAQADPFTPVPRETQERAMKAMSRWLFGPEAFQADAGLYRHLQEQRRGFDHFGSNEDPKIHARVLEIQRNALNHLLHRNVLARIEDSEMYGNEYVLAEVLKDLTKAVMEGEATNEVGSLRRQLQSHYVGRLIAISGLEGSSDYSENAKAGAFYQLTRIRVRMDRSITGLTDATRAHRAFLLHRIERAMDRD